MPRDPFQTRFNPGRKAPYARLFSRNCDWCGVHIEAAPQYTWQRDRTLTKFRSPIDGTHVRARLCDTHREKILSLMEGP